MSKKIAAGADAILLDVKVGSGAFMKTLEDSRALAREMVRIGSQVGRQTVALITDMDMPLGRKIGNALEVQEAARCSPAKGDHRLRSLCLELSANMVYLGRQAETMEGAGPRPWRHCGPAGLWRSCARWRRPRAATNYITNPEKFTISRPVWKSPRPRRVHHPLGRRGLRPGRCGAGRGPGNKKSSIDPGAGIILLKNKGDRVEQGQPIARLYAQSEAPVPPGGRALLPGPGGGHLSSRNRPHAPGPGGGGVIPAKTGTAAARFCICL